MERLRNSMAIYWPAIMAVGTVILACLIDHGDTTGLTLRWDTERARALLLSP